MPACVMAIAFFGALVPGMVMSTLICCGNEFEEAVKPFGPFQRKLGPLQPAEWWGMLVVTLACLSFVLVRVTDAIWFQCGSDELLADSSRTYVAVEEDSSTLNIIFDWVGYTVGAIALVMAILAFRWLKPHEVARKDEENMYDYDLGNTTIIPELEVKLPQLLQAPIAPPYAVGLHATVVANHLY